MDETIIKLQTIVGHQEHEISQLSNELYLQQKQIAALNQEMVELRERLKTLADAVDTGINIIDEPPPPHY